VTLTDQEEWVGGRVGESVSRWTGDGEVASVVSVVSVLRAED
jgi:hypothetical protein